MWELPLPEPVLREALPSPEVLAERLALITMIVNLSVTTDEEKYTDVLESVQRWEYADLKAFQEKQKAAASAEQPTHRNKGVPDARCFVWEIWVQPKTKHSINIHFSLSFCDLGLFETSIFSAFRQTLFYHQQLPFHCRK